MFNSLNTHGSCRIKAVRTGSNIAVTIDVSDYSRNIGYGLQNPSEVTSSGTGYTGSIELVHGSTTTVLTSPTNTYNFSSVGAINLQVGLQLPSVSGYTSLGTITIGASDGAYIDYTVRQTY